MPLCPRQPSHEQHQRACDEGKRKSQRQARVASPCPTHPTSAEEVPESSHRRLPHRSHPDPRLHHQAPQLLHFGLATRVSSVLGSPSAWRVAQLLEGLGQTVHVWSPPLWPAVLPILQSKHPGSKSRPLALLGGGDAPSRGALALSLHWIWQPTTKPEHPSTRKTPLQCSSFGQASLHHFANQHVFMDLALRQNKNQGPGHKQMPWMLTPKRSWQASAAMQQAKPRSGEVRSSLATWQDGVPAQDYNLWFGFAYIAPSDHKKDHGGNITKRILWNPTHPPHFEMQETDICKWFPNWNFEWIKVSGVHLLYWCARVIQ